jgi:hypothetical protein
MSKRKVYVVGCEGEIEGAVELVYLAMMGEAKAELNFLCTTPFIYKQTLTYLLWYLEQKKAPKVKHVTVDIYIEKNKETTDDTDEPDTRFGSGNEDEED